MRVIEYLCVIPARGGSKRIPRKNIKEFCGKPIIAYSIEAALESGLFDEVMVSTDDEEIKSVAEALGARVPFYRSKKASDDFTTLAEVLLEVIGEYEQSGVGIETLCCVLPTAPFLTPKRLEEAFAHFGENKFESLIPVLRFSYPIQRALKQVEGRVAFFDSQYESTRSQDLEPAYHDVGQFYYTTVSSLKLHRSLFTPQTGMIELDESEVQDIDTFEDWKMAEFKYRYLFEGDNL